MGLHTVHTVRSRTSETTTTRAKHNFNILVVLHLVLHVTVLLVCQMEVLRLTYSCGSIASMSTLLYIESATEAADIHKQNEDNKKAIDCLHTSLMEGIPCVVPSHSCQEQ